MEGNLIVGSSIVRRVDISFLVDGQTPSDEKYTGLDSESLANVYDLVEKIEGTNFVFVHE
jgi:hypothetical protein